MDDAQWTRAKHILNDLLDADPDNPAAWLDDRCAGDEALRTEVESLFRAYRSGTLAAGDEAAGWIEGEAGAADPSGAARLEGQRVGPYRLVEEIGVGGMSVVYRAERAAGDFEQTVAVKLLQRRLHADDAEQRFRAERQVLASLDHPNIAGLVDGGVTEGGRPYLVMELVDGVPLTDYADAHDLGLEARLDLLAQVLDAVEAAHQQLVVHRDLKPSNVLVTDTDEGPQVKLLDFGIAKLLDDSLPVTRPETATGHHLLTPAYATPEQVTGGDITTRTDVYQLGVLAYELLADARPFDLSGKPLTEIERTILEAEPPAPSAAAPEQGGRARALRGDLDVILQKALRKEPGRRYASVEALAADLRRYRTGEPIEARPATLGYRARKFVTRHATGVGVAAAFLAVLVAAGALLVEQRNQARREAETAQQVTSYLVQLFEANRLRTQQTDSLDARALLDRGRRRINTLSGQPAVQARLLRVMGKVHLTLGDYDRAQRLYARSLEQYRSVHSGPHPDIALALSGLGSAQEEQGAYDAAIARHREALATYQRLSESASAARASVLIELGEALRETGAPDSAVTVQQRALRLYWQAPEADSVDIGRVLASLGISLREQGNLERSETVQRRAQALFREHLPPDHRWRISAQRNLSSVLGQRGQHAEAAQRLREVIATYRERGAGQHPAVAEDLSSLGVMLRKQGNPEEAEQAYREALAIARKHLDPPHSDLARYLNNLGVALKQQGAYAEAARVHQQALSMRRAVFGDNHPAVIESLNNLATLRYTQGRVDQAIQRMRAVHEACHAHLGPNHPRTAVSGNNLAVMLSEQGRHAAAVPFYRDAVPTYTGAFEAGHPRVVKLKTRLAESLVALERFTAADSLLTATHQAMQAAESPDSTSLSLLHTHLVDLYEAWGKPEQAKRYRLAQQSSGEAER